jgi:hypothetical protein
MVCLRQAFLAKQKMCVALANMRGRSCRIFAQVISREKAKEIRAKIEKDNIKIQGGDQND